MRINKYIALATGLSRREADRAVAEGRVHLNGSVAPMGAMADESARVVLDGQPLNLPATTETILLHKPVGYVCSRNGQGSKTIYDLLPASLHHLKPIGRLDKDSSGLLLLTNDGELAHKLTHPSFQKEKVYLVTLNSPLSTAELSKLRQGVALHDGPSHLALREITAPTYEVRLSEGRNRQIRRTFEAVGKKVIGLHRTTFGEFSLGSLAQGRYQPL